jgi:hypothetical protein
MVWDVRVLGEVESWLLDLDDDTYEQVVAAIDKLADDGPALGRPLADRIEGSRHHNMKELRPGSAGRSEVRILFAFDPERRAVLLVAGDKAGDWTQWYRRNVRSQTRGTTNGYEASEGDDQDRGPGCPVVDRGPGEAPTSRGRCRRTPRPHGCGGSRLSAA